MTEPERRDTTGATSSAADPTRPVEPAADPATRAPGDPVSDQTTAVHPLPQQPRDETLPGTTRSPFADDGGTTSGRTTWHPEPDPRDHPDETRPEWSTNPVAVRRSDPVAAFLLLLSGIAAGVSLLLPWTPDGPTGLDLLRDGLDTLGQDWTQVFSNGLWQPLGVLFGGGVLFVLGLLLLVPAKAHRFLGVLALLVALAVVAAVLVPLAEAGWDLAAFGAGFYAALAVAGLGLLGALKATLTGKKLA